METYAVYLWPRGSLASEIGSDTLFGAVCWALQILRLTDVGKLLGNFVPPRFAFSSLFPVYRPNGRKAGIPTPAPLRFWPRPLTGSLTPGQVNQLAEELRQRKPSDYKHRPGGAAVANVVDKDKRQLKPALYISEGLFKEIVETGLTAPDLYRRLVEKGSKGDDIGYKSGLLFRYDECARLCSRKDWPQVMRTTAVQHNQIDRVAGSSVEGLLFFEAETFFAAGAGLWCVARVDGDETRRWLEAAFRYLSDTGLGANRTAGKGHFQIEWGEPIQLPDAGEAANAFVTLSRYLPVKDEWSPEGRPLSYEIRTVWGKREQKFPRPSPGSKSPPVYKAPVRMFAPGSVFPFSGKRQEVYGSLAEVVRDENGSVWQSGLAVPVFARIAAGGEQ